MHNVAFSQRDRLLAVWRNNKRALKSMDVLIAIVDVPPTFRSRHYISNIDRWSRRTHRHLIIAPIAARYARRVMAVSGATGPPKE
jgi:hypothetical protein